MFKSTDGGKTWKKTLFRDNRTGAVDLSIDPRNPKVMLRVAVGSVPHAAGRCRAAGRAAASSSPPTAATPGPKSPRIPGCRPACGARSASAVSPADGNRAWALIENEAEGGLFLSDDAGATWTKVSDNRNIRQRAFYYIAPGRRPQGEGHGLPPERAVLPSTDAGKTLTPIRVPHGDNHDLWISPGDNQRMIQSNDGGANVSVNRRPDLDRPGHPDRRSSTTSSPPGTCRITSAARSRTTPPPAWAARPRAAPGKAVCRQSSTPSAGARAATSPPTRPIPTCFTPAATAAT